MAPRFGQDLERRVGDLLDRIPGYRGYRAKEDRRDADRRVREHVAGAFAAQADRVERVARRLAADRRLADIGPVDELARSLRHLVDRIRTATYGYGGLFGDRDVDAAALDQLRQFDQGLLSGVQELDKPIADLEAALAATSDLAAPARAGTERARAIHRRLDLRGEVIETGKPAPTESVLRVLEPPKTEAPPPAFDLHDGDALAILGDDYLVDSRIEIQGDDAAVRLFRLSGGSREQWLLVTGAEGAPLALLSPASGADGAGAETVIDGTAYTAQSSGSGDGQVVGVGGKSDWREVTFTLLAGADDPRARAIVLDWGNERQVLAGREIHPDDVEVFGRPSRQLN